MTDYQARKNRLVKRLLLATNELEEQGNYNIRSYASRYSDILQDIFKESELEEFITTWDIFEYMFETQKDPEDIVVDILNKVDEEYKKLSNE